MPKRLKGVTTKIHLSRPNLTLQSIYLKDKVIQSKWWIYMVARVECENNQYEVFKSNNIVNFDGNY